MNMGEKIKMLKLFHASRHYNKHHTPLEQAKAYSWFCRAKAGARYEWWFKMKYDEGRIEKIRKKAYDDMTGWYGVGKKDIRYLLSLLPQQALPSDGDEVLEPQKYKLPDGYCLLDNHTCCKDDCRECPKPSLKAGAGDQQKEQHSDFCKCRDCKERNEREGKHP